MLLCETHIEDKITYSILVYILIKLDLRYNK